MASTAKSPKICLTPVFTCSIFRQRSSSASSRSRAAGLIPSALARPVSLRADTAEYRELEADMLAAVNKLGIGAQGFGGDVTALAVNIEHYPTHIAGLPVAVNINCHVMRHKEVVL